MWKEVFAPVQMLVNLALNTTITALTPHFLLLSVLITVITNRASCEYWLESCHLGEKLVKHQYSVFQHIYASGHVIGKIRKRHCRRVMHVLFLLLLLCINHIKIILLLKNLALENVGKGMYLMIRDSAFVSKMVSLIALKWNRDSFFGNRQTEQCHRQSGPNCPEGQTPVVRTWLRGHIVFLCILSQEFTPPANATDLEGTWRVSLATDLLQVHVNFLRGKVHLLLSSAQACKPDVSWSTDRPIPGEEICVSKGKRRNVTLVNLHAAGSGVEWERRSSRRMQMKSWKDRTVSATLWMDRRWTHLGK